MIEVILLERIERLGQMGQIVKVRPGYARNFLLPLNKALRATEANKEVFEKQRAELEAKNAAERSKAEATANKIGELKIVVIRQASDMGQLYGSVTSRDVADAAKEAGHTIDRAQIQIDTPIKSLGLFPVKAKLHPEVTLKISVNVARSAEEAVVQAEKGVALIKANAAAEAAAAEAAAVAAIGTPAVAPVEATEEADAKPKKKAKAAKAEDAAEGEEPKAKKVKAKKAS